MKVGFVGIGLMGLPMASRIIKAGHQVYIYSKNQISKDKLLSLGAIAEDSIISVANKSEIFCNCRVTDEHSKDVFIGKAGVINSKNKPKICIDFATINPKVSIKISSLLKNAKISFLDAPVSGGPDAAENGSLSIIIGGDLKTINVAKQLFKILGNNIFHMGDVGTGVTSKLCNNLISITTHALIAEAMILGKKSGIDSNKLYEVIRNSSGYSKTLDRVVPNHFLKRNFKAKATMTMIMKDLKSALDLAETHKISLLLASNAMKYFIEASNDGHALDDISSVILPMEKKSGIKVGYYTSENGRII